MSIASDSLNYSNRGSKRIKIVSLLQLAEDGNHEGILKIDDDQTDISSLQIRMENADTALHVAASRGHTKAVSVLMGTVINVHVTGHRKRTPLHCSAENGHLVVTKRLLDAGARVDVKDAHGATALHLAEKNMHAEVVLLLARKGAAITDHTIWLAVLNDNKELVYLCLQKGKSVHTMKDGHSLVAMAAREGNWEMLIFLLNRDADPTKYKTTEESPLVYASRAGKIEAVRQILEKGAKSDSGQVKRALLEVNNRSVMHIFLNVVTGFIDSELGRLILLDAAGKGKLEILEVLCDAGMQVNLTDGNGQTALHHAAANGHTSCVKELISRGANVNHVSEKGDTALHAAVKADHAECVRVLLSKGADPKLKNKSRKTPLDLAKSDEVRQLLPSKRIRAPRGEGNEKNDAVGFISLY